MPSSRLRTLSSQSSLDGTSEIASIFTMLLLHSFLSLGLCMLLRRSLYDVQTIDVQKAAGLGVQFVVAGQFALHALFQPVHLHQFLGRIDAGSRMVKGMALTVALGRENLYLPIAELSGFEVEICNRGDTGLTRALNEEFDLIILDLMLPEVDGFDICRQVRQEKNTPIIMVSAKKDDIDKIRGLGLGADDYMTKPFSPSELVARVKAHMDRYNRLIGSNVRKNDIVEIRGIKIDKTARRVWVNGEEKTFTSKEYDLLTFLAENPNRVFTKEELFREIWDMESVGDIATVTVHIKKIREKIEFNTAKPQYIETIWGVGYRFKV